MVQAELLLISCALLPSLGLLACGPSHVHLDPRDVTAVRLKLPTSEPIFCPGQPMRLSLRAALKDGSTCSSDDPESVCMGQKGALIDGGDIRIEGTSGALRRGGADLLWIPPADALSTAEQGMSLRAWLSSTAEGAKQTSPVAELALRPVYHCMRENVFSSPPPSEAGQNGGRGPDLKVSVTLFATPFYPDALLIRVEQSGRRTYIIATDRSKQVTVISKGQSGARGSPGLAGSDGSDGADGASRDGAARVCQPGGNGTAGTSGKAGGNGGNGGNGGTIQLFIDEAAMEKARGWLGVASLGGDPGAPGPGGLGGPGGRGGHHSEALGCTAPDGEPGPSGARGASGAPGRRGLDGPLPTGMSASRRSIFTDDLAVIERIEAAARRRP